MLLIKSNPFRPKLISIILNTIKTNRLIKSNNNCIKYRLFIAMEEIIHEINTNHSKMIKKIRELEQKIEFKENSNESKATKRVLTEEDINREKQRLLKENEGLKQEVNRLVNDLNQLEAKRNPNSTQVSTNGVTTQTNESKESVLSDQNKERKQTEKKEKKPKPNANKTSAEDDKPIDVSRLDLRVGRILSAKRHPDADSLYVEEIDCGDEKPRTVVSGLVKFVPLEQMSNRPVVVLCNLKPAKMRGITSEAMVMCASSPESVQILDPPEGSQPGDRILFDKYPGTADPQLNPKKKIWEQIAPDLKTDSDCIATYKGEPFKVESKGVVRAQSLANVAVK